MDVKVYVPWVVVAFIIACTLAKTLLPRTLRTLEEMVPHLRNASLVEVKELINPADEGYLRLNLPSKAFRQAQINRLYLLREHLMRMSHNAVTLQQWATFELAKSGKTANKGATDTSRELIQYCFLFRIASAIVRLRLRFWLMRIRLLPFVSIPMLAEARKAAGTDIAYTYERIRETADKLCITSGSRCQSKLSILL